MSKQVFLNICYERFKETGVEKEQFRCLLNDVGFNYSHCYSYIGIRGCEYVGEPLIKALVLAAILQQLWRSTKGS